MNNLKKRFTNALKILTDDYGISTPQIAERTGLKLSSIRSAKYGRPAAITIESVMAIERLIKDIQEGKTNKPVLTVEQRIDRLESELAEVLADTAKIEKQLRKLLNDDYKGKQMLVENEKKPNGK